MYAATEKQTNRINGVELDTLLDTVEAIRQDPELGVARFRASNTWMDGNQNRSTVTGFYGAKHEAVNAAAF